MSIKQAETIGHHNVLSHLLWALDLYDTKDRSSRLNEMRSYDQKQSIYIETLQDRLIQALCDQTPAVSVLVNGLLDFSEAATTVVLSKTVISPIAKEKIYHQYTKHILCPILVSCIELMMEFREHSPFVRHLDELLKRTNEHGLAHAARRMLLDIIDIPECKVYLGELINLIGNIKPGRNQRRATIRGYIQSATIECNSIRDVKIRNKCLNQLVILQDAYSACIAAIYFDNKTGLGQYLARHYQEASDKFIHLLDVRIKSLSGMITTSIYAKNTLGLALSHDAKEHIEKLWCFAVKELPAVKNKYHNQSIQSLFYLLNEPDFNSLPIKTQEKAEKFINQAMTDAKLGYLKPYAAIFHTLHLIKNNELEKASQLLADNITTIYNDTVGSLPFHASMLQIALAIKLTPSEIKNGRFTSLVQNIINSQSLYADARIDDSFLLQLHYESFITHHYSHSILRSIRYYNDLVCKRLCISEERPQQAILDTWCQVEYALSKIDKKLDCLTGENIETSIHNILTKAEKEKPLITYLPSSTLYNCVRECLGLRAYLHISDTDHPCTSKMLSDTQYRLTLLKTLNPTQFEEESRCRALN
ncbi:hypothetical protein [Aeromonas caviae]